MEVVNLYIFARNLKVTTCRMEMKNRTYKTADYGREEKYDATKLPKWENKKTEQLHGNQDKHKN